MNIIFPKKNRYQIIKTTTPDNRIHYGIALKSDPTVFVSEISTDFEFVKEIIRKINKGNLSPIHLLDIVEDSLP